MRTKDGSVVAVREDTASLRQKFLKYASSIQGVGLVCLTGLSFFPRWSHKAEYLFFGLLLFALVVAWATRSFRWISTPIDVPLILFASWVLLTIPFAVDSRYSFTEWRKFVAHILLFYWATAVLENQRGQKWTRGVMWVIVLGTIVLSGHALIDFFLRGGTWRDRLVRASAPSSDYNWLSTYMVMAIPLVAIGSAVVRGSMARGVFALGSCMGLFAQVFSYTRAGWLSSFLQLCLGTLVMGRRMVSLAICLGGLAFLGIFIAFSRMGYQADTVDSLPVNARVAVWKLAAKTIMEHPIVGAGYGNDTFIRVYAGYEETKKAPASHNIYLMLAMGSGMPALILFIWIFVAAGRVLYRGIHAAKESGSQLILLAVLLTVFGALVRNTFDVMLMGSLGCLFWIIVAVGLHLAKLVQHAPAVRHIHL